MNLKKEIVKQVYRYVDPYIGSVQHQLNQKGDYAMSLPGYDKIFITVGTTEEFINAVKELLNEKVIVGQPDNALCAFFDGGPVPNLPLAKRKYQYKTDHWICVLLKKGPKFNEYFKNNITDE